MVSRSPQIQSVHENELSEEGAITMINIISMTDRKVIKLQRFLRESRVVHCLLPEFERL